MHCSNMSKTSLKFESSSTGNKVKKDTSSHNWKINYFWSEYHSTRWQRRNTPMWSITRAVEEKIKIDKTLNTKLKGRNHEQYGVRCRRLWKKKKIPVFSFRRSKERHCLKLLSNKTFQKHMSPYLPDEIALDSQFWDIDYRSFGASNKKMISCGLPGGIFYVKEKLIWLTLPSKKQSKITMEKAFWVFNKVWVKDFKSIQTLLVLHCTRIVVYMQICKQNFEDFVQANF